MNSFFKSDPRRFLVIFSSILLFLNSCSKDSSTGTTNSNTNPNPNPTGQGIVLTGISVSPATAAINQNTTQQCTVAYQPAGASGTVSWSSSNNAAATVNANGLVTAISPGQAVITATSTANAAYTSSVAITVLKNYDIYLGGNGAGVATAATAIDYYASVWKNGILTQLHGGYDEGRSVNDITVVNNNVYAAGTTLNNSLDYVPTLWVNSTVIQLGPTTNAYSHWAKAVAVSGSDAYVCGYFYNSTGTTPYTNASLWKVNGTTVTSMPLPFANGLVQSDAWDVATSGTDVYTSGSIFNNMNSLAVYWKNSLSPVILSASGSHAEGEAIAVSGTDVYVAGYEFCPSCPVTLKLWKNDMSHYVVLASQSNSMNVSGISVSGSDIYVSGSVSDANYVSTAMLWKVTGSTVTPIILSDGIQNIVTTSVMASGNDEFVTGYITIHDYGIYYPKSFYWRLYNGVLVAKYDVAPPVFQMPPSADPNWSRLYSIFVK